MLDSRGINSDSKITIDIFLDMMKPSNTMIPAEVMDALREEYKDMKVVQMKKERRFMFLN